MLLKGERAGERVTELDRRATSGDRLSKVNKKVWVAVEYLLTYLGTYYIKSTWKRVAT